MTVNFKELTTKEFWNQFITQDFWFSVDSTRIHNIDYAIGLVGILGLVLGVGWLIKAKKQVAPFAKELWKRFSKLSFYMGAGFIIWFLLRQQAINYLATHFVVAIIAVWGLVWLWLIYKKLGKTYSVNLANWQKEQTKQKYLKMSTK